MIVQEYMDKPFLVDGYKADMRIYVLITSCDPLRVFLYNDGLLRLSTEKYLIPHDSNVVCLLLPVLMGDHGPR
jgi:tubulin polyglutamylase TTLL7